MMKPAICLFLCAWFDSNDLLTPNTDCGSGSKLKPKIVRKNKKVVWKIIKTDILLFDEAPSNCCMGILDKLIKSSESPYSHSGVILREISWVICLGI